VVYFKPLCQKDVNRGSSVGIPTRLRAERAGRSGFDSRRRLGIFLLAAASRPAVGPIELPTQIVRGILSPGAKRPGHEADHSPLYSADVKNTWSDTSSPPYGFTSWCLVKYRDNFTFTFYARRAEESHESLQSV
jgi:hypothetical protein